MFQFRVFLTAIFSFINVFSYSQPIKRKVLFIGNSYIYENNLPQITADFAVSLSDTLLFDSSTPGGYTLNDHSSNSTTINKVTTPRLGLCYHAGAKPASCF